MARIEVVEIWRLEGTYIVGLCCCTAKRIKLDIEVTVRPGGQRSETFFLVQQGEFEARYKKLTDALEQYNTRLNNVREDPPNKGASQAKSKS